MTNIITNNYKFSRVNYTDAFLKLWVAFNGYYPKSEGSELERAKSVAENSDFFNNYFNSLFELVPDRRVEFLLMCIEDLSNRTTTDTNGNQHVSNVDDTSTKYKVHSDMSNVHTVFFKLARNANPVLLSGEKSHVDKTRFCHDKNKRIDHDTVISAPYNSYNKYLATESGIVFLSDFINNLPTILSNRGILQVGELLFADNSASFNKLGDETKHEDTKNEKLIEFKQNSAKELLKLELNLLYKLRCAIMHGDIDIENDSDADELSKAAYNALDSMMSFLKLRT